MVIILLYKTGGYLDVILKYLLVQYNIIFYIRKIPFKKISQFLKK